MKELIITSPEGYEIDKEKSTFEKIVFKPIDTKPRSWEEYWKNNFKNKAFLGVNFVQGLIDDKNATFHCNGVIHQIPMSIELAEAFLAMMQLMSLRQAWIGNWKSDWENGNTKKWCIIFEWELKVSYFYSNAKALSFPTEEMAIDFMNCFKDLLNVARPLI